MNKEFEYKGTKVVVIKKRMKNMYMRWKDYSYIQITCPKLTPTKQILKFLDRFHDQIKKPTNPEVKFMGTVNIFGKEIKLPFEDEKLNRNFIKEYAKKHFTQYVKNMSIELGFGDVTVQFRDMKSKWGVCHYTKNKIVLNSRLLLKTLSEFNYVIIHELCHFIQPNHSKEYWQEVGLRCPNWKEERKKLKKHA